jgi:hypothetical protein
MASIKEIGSDLLAIAKLFTNDLKVVMPKGKGRGFKSMFKDSIRKDKNIKSMMDEFKEDMAAIKNKRYAKAPQPSNPKIEPERHETPPPTQSDVKPRAYYLDQLGLAADATQEQAKAKYRELALKYHPDKNKSSWASTRFIQLQDAWEHLK